MWGFSFLLLIRHLKLYAILGLYALHVQRDIITNYG